MRLWIPNCLKNYLIERAMLTPYFHLDGYMERYWLVPFSTPKHWHPAFKEHEGCGTVSIFKRPIAWMFQKLGIAIRVHKILRSDNGRDFHNHPWNFITILLKGSYFEIIPKFNESGIYQGELKTFYTSGDLLYRKHSHFHRLNLLVSRIFNNRKIVEIQYTPVWTLFITFRKKRTWGFIEKPYGVTPHFLYQEKQNEK